MFSKQLINSLCTLIWAASDAICSYYKMDYTAKRKADGSPLTLADLASHKIIQQGLHELTPEIPIISEEGPAISFSQRSSWSKHWLVDPLDGTAEFIRGNGEFTVNLALIENHSPVFGIVGVPAQNLLFVGCPEQNLCYADKLGVGKQNLASRTIAKELQSDNQVVVLVSRSNKNKETESWLAKNVLNPRLEAVGSALKFCRLADGSADIYPRFSPTCEWDTAAPHALLRAAGGEIYQLDGNPLQYNNDKTLLNKHFIAVADTNPLWLKTLNLSQARLNIIS